MKTIFSHFGTAIIVIIAVLALVGITSAIVTGDGGVKSNISEIFEVLPDADEAISKGSEIGGGNSNTVSYGNALATCDVSADPNVDNVKFTIYDSGVGVVSGVGKCSEEQFMGQWILCGYKTYQEALDDDFIETKVDQDTYYLNTIYDINKLVVENGVTSIGPDMFSYLPIKEIKFPSTLKEIGDYAFWNAPLENSLILNEGLTTIGLGAFDLFDPSTSKLEEITIPSTLTSMYCSFSDSGNLKKVNISNIENWCNIDFQVSAGVGIENPLGCTNAYLYLNGSKITNLTIPEGVTTINPYAFYKGKIEKVSLPSTLKTIGNSAFEYCKLTSLSIPNGVTTIGEKAFNSNNALKTVDLPSTVTQINKGAFTNLASGSIIKCETESVFNLLSSGRYGNYTSTNTTVQM